MQPQSVASGLTSSAIFLVVVLSAGDKAAGAARGLLANLPALVRATGFRSATGELSCVAGIGSEAWDRMFGAPRPSDLHPFREIRGVHHAVATPGDMLFHIRAAGMDLCFELAMNIMSQLDGLATLVDEVHGFSYFDRRDLLGFVDGTENPTGQDAADATLIGAEDPAFVGGSYVIVQKYLHDLAAWNALPVETQERIIGRRKLSDIELSDAEKPSYAHNALTSITADGQEVQILRDNMPFGDMQKGEFGTYFIGYARTPRHIERMLQNMFVGHPPGNHDRILDFSKAVTGTLFFVPSASLLDRLGSGAVSAEPEPAPTPAHSPHTDGSLGIGSLRTGKAP
ncbi:Dyp-type peroxidase [Tabrizicola sp.]|uniref:Dyp-type peroxidase n=1 Tax=Tabrizicola sp. TaxID=2005166 RepID=UPI0035AE1966